MHIDYFKRPLFLILIFYSLFLVAKHFNTKTPHDILNSYIGSDAIITGRVALYSKTKNEVKSVVINVRTIDGAAANGRVYATLPRGFEAEYMENIEVYGSINAPFSIAAPGNFDWRNFLANKKVYTQMKVAAASVLAPAPVPLRWTNALRKSILKTFDNNFTPDMSSILGGVTLGDNSLNSRELHTAFQDSGAMHLLVASGGNVGFVTLIIYFLCMACGVKHNLRLPLALLAAGIYTLIAGADAPLLRAYLMTLCAGMGLQIGRSSGAFHGLIMAALIILIVTPGSLFETGFQMSFLATMSILFTVSTIKLPKMPRLIKAALEIFLITFFIQLALLPIYTNVFYKVSLAGVISNILLIPLAAIVMALGFLLYLAKLTGIIFIFKFFWALNYAAVWTFEHLVRGFAALPFASVSTPSLTVPSIAIFYTAFFIFFIKRGRIITPVLALILLLTIFINPFKTKNFIYIINARGENAVIVNNKHKTLLFYDNFDREILQNALFSTGLRKADIEVSEEPLGLAKKSLKPFEDIWPGEEVLGINAGWSFEKGYSGSRRDGLNYKYANILIDGKSGFVKVDNIKTYADKNKTAVIKL